MDSISLPSIDVEHRLHLVMFPWLAFGHITPFLELSKSLAQKGHRISFISTPRNIQRLPKLPPNLSRLITLVNLPLPQVDNLPENAEATVDIPLDLGPYLKKAFDGLEGPLVSFLEDSNPDWIIYDYAAHWLPPTAAKLGVPCAYFNIFNASMVAFYGPISEMMSNERSRMTPEDFTVPPKWVSFPSNLALRLHEAPKHPITVKRNASSDVYRLGSAIQGCDVMAVRSCTEFESDWLHFLEEDLFRKPIIPVGLLPPSAQDSGDDQDEKWMVIGDWLDKQRKGSVVYIALGSEVILSPQDVNELALGLELSELPFFWVLRKPPGSGDDDSVVLPAGFEDRTSDRGMVCKGWAPQLRILAHPSVGGFLTHCGWSSIVEGLGFGLALVLLPMSPPQALNARMLEWKKVGLEIPRNERDGSFTRDSVAESLRVVMVDKEGENSRAKAKEMRYIFGNKDCQDRYVDDFDRYLIKHRR